MFLYLKLTRRMLLNHTQKKSPDQIIVIYNIMYSYIIYDLFYYYIHVAHTFYVRLCVNIATVELLTRIYALYP